MAGGSLGVEIVFSGNEQRKFIRRTGRFPSISAVDVLSDEFLLSAVCCMVVVQAARLIDELLQSPVCKQRAPMFLAHLLFRLAG